MVGADIVEVAPAFDGTGEQTALTAAQLGFEILTSWVGKGMRELDGGQVTGTETVESGTDSGKDEL